MIHQRKPIIGVFVLTTMINHYLLMFTFLVDWESQHLRMVSQFIMLFVHILYLMISYVFPNWWFLFGSMPPRGQFEFQWRVGFFFTPYRVDGTPMPASVMKFDQKECGMAPEDGR
jgi:hypothetical protein